MGASGWPVAPTTASSKELLDIRRGGYYATSVARATVEAELDNFVLRLQHLNSVRV